VKRLLAVWLCLSLPVPGLAAVPKAVVVKTQAPTLARTSVLPTLIISGALPVLSPGSSLPAPKLQPAPQITEAVQLQLRQISLAPEKAALAFDGAGGGSGNANPNMGTSGSESSPRTGLKPYSPPEAPSRRKFSSTSFKIGTGLGIVAAAVAPIAWDAAPVPSFLYTLQVSLIMALPFVFLEGIVALTRSLLRPRPPTRRPTVKTRLKSAALGLLLGTALVLGSLAIKPVLIERAPNILISGTEQPRRLDSRHQAQIIAALEANPQGRDVLDGLRDRDGKIRLPQFYVGRKDSSHYASYNGTLDAVFINDVFVGKKGISKEEFLTDSAKQATFLAGFMGTVAHELRHAGQERRGLGYPGHAPAYNGLFTNWLQVEYEAFLTDHWFSFEELKAGRPFDLQSVLEPLDGLPAYFVGIDKLYPNNVRSVSPYWEGQLAKYTADWEKHRLEAYTLLAKWAVEQKDAKKAAEYLKKAQEAAKTLGVPAP
jgi:hypothetical protein